MKIDTQYKPELLISPDITRTSTHIGMYYDTDAKLLCATNGHAFVGVPVTVEAGESSGYVTAEILKAARQFAKKAKLAESTIEVTKTELRTFNGATKTTAARPKAQFPAWRQLLPEIAPGDDNTVTVTLNAQLLLDVQKALNAATVTLVIPRPTAPTVGVTDAIRVYAPKDERCCGVIMPCDTSKNTKRGA